MSWFKSFMSRNATDVSMDVDRLKTITKARTAITNDRFENLRSELERTKIINVALVRILIAKKAFTELELNKVIDEIDLEDGIKDGKITKKPPNKALHRSR